MICQACRDHHHEDCRGGTWCDCQHQSPADTEDHRTEEPPPEPDGSEPPVNWLRQG